ncbi:MAG: ABC transporter permease [Actinomycetota bacterium]|nr:ABC transporter permease [Actinomycetota bacterium]
MIGFVLRRLVQSVLVVIGVTIIVFVLIRLLPGGTARATLGPRATAAEIHAFVVANGLNHPIPVQYVLYLKRLLSGNLGYSYHYNESVASLLATNVPKTALLVGLAYAVSLLVSVPLGIYQAVKRNSVGDYAVTAVAFVGYAMPTFWAGMLLILGFAITWPVLPAEAPQGATVGAILSQPSGLVLPVVTLAFVNFAMFSRFMRSSAIENLVQDYIRTARAKGMRSWWILYRHLLPNSLGPIVSLVGLSLPVVLSGAVVAEAVFNFPGMGLLFWNAALKQDYPLMMGFTVVVSVATVLGSLVADICYAIIDPRVRFD